MNIRKIFVIGFLICIIIGIGLFYQLRKRNVGSDTGGIKNESNDSGLLGKYNNIQNSEILDNEVVEGKQNLSVEQHIENIETLGRGWILHNLKKDGSFIYLCDLQGEEKSEQNNIIRELLMFRVVAKLCQNEGGEFCEIHKKNLEYVFSQDRYKEKNFGNVMVGYILNDNRSALGTSALAIRLVVASPYFDDYKKYLPSLINGIKFLQNDDGSFREAFFVKPKKQYDLKRRLRFYSGESGLALLEYYRKTNDQEALNLAKKIEDFYYGEYIDRMADNYYPAYIPWHTMAFSKLWHITGDQKYLDGIFLLNDKLLEIQDENFYLGRFYDEQHPEYGPPHSASDGIYTESLITAYKLALEVDEKKRQQDYVRAIKLSLNNLASLQLCNPVNVDVADYSKKMCGAMQIRAGGSASRVDSLAHTMDALFSLKSILGLQ